MALTTDEPILTSTVQPPATSPETPRPHRRRSTIVGWVGVGIAVAATAAVSIAVLRPEPDRPVDDNLRTVIEHGSITAIDHRLDLQRLAPPTAGLRCRSVAYADQPDAWWCPPW